MAKHKLSRRSFVWALGGGLVIGGCQKKQKAMKKGKRVILLGMDGLDPVFLKKYMDEGLMPACRTLSQEGGFSALATTNPPQSPVAWTTIATGMNPGRHGIFDFLARDPETYSIALSITRPKGASWGVPQFAPPFQVKTFWERACEKGVESTVLRWPLAFPAKGPGFVLGGLGVPDIRGRLADYSLYTTAAIPESDDKNRYRVPLSGGDKNYQGELRGPAVSKNKFATVPFQVACGEKEAAITVAGESFVLKEHAWSDPLSLTFSPGLFRKVAGVGRFYLAKADDPLVLYFSPVAVDPEKPVFPIAAPEGFSKKLYEHAGRFNTLGMPEDVNAAKQGVLSPDALFESCKTVMGEQERMLDYALSRQKHGIVSCVFFTPDRVQHMFYAGAAPGHVFNTQEAKRNDLFSHVDSYHAFGEEPVRGIYKRVDSIVAEVRRSLSGDDHLVVLSDHGFTSLERFFHVNKFLSSEGYMSFAPGGGGGEIFPQVKWRGTRAYSMGFAGIYINLAGREREGVVRDDKAAELQDEIAAKLDGLRDPATGLKPVRRVWKRSELYTGPLAEKSPDLILGLEKGYRFSEETTCGRSAETLFSVNTLPWTGTHLVDPALVPGVLLSNRAIKSKQPKSIDIAASVLDSLDLPVPKELEGGTLF